MKRISIVIDCEDSTCGVCRLLTFRESTHENGYWCLGYSTIPEGYPPKRCRYCIEAEHKEADK